MLYPTFTVITMDNGLHGGIHWVRCIFYKLDWSRRERKIYVPNSCLHDWITCEWLMEMNETMKDLLNSGTNTFFMLNYVPNFMYY